jgi:hypothetical protein
VCVPHVTAHFPFSAFAREAERVRPPPASPADGEWMRRKACGTLSAQRAAHTRGDTPSPSLAVTSLPHTSLLPRACGKDGPRAERGTSAPHSSPHRLPKSCQCIFELCVQSKQPRSHMKDNKSAENGFTAGWVACCRDFYPPCSQTLSRWANGTAPKWSGTSIDCTKLHVLPSHYNHTISGKLVCR